MGATTARGRDVVRPRLPHRLLSQHSVGGSIDRPHKLVVRRRGDRQRMAHRQRVRYRSTFTTYFRRSVSRGSSMYLALQSHFHIVAAPPATARRHSAPNGGHTAWKVTSRAHSA